MPIQHFNPQPEVGDLENAPRTDGYVELVSLLGYGTLVVTTERAAELVASLEWAEVDLEEE